MEINNIWGKLNIPVKDSFRKDIQEGKVPELPYYIVDQEDLKQKIKDKIFAIDGDRMSTSYITAAYGNGKTNVFRYLELFFNKTYSSFNIDILYSRADPERVDLVVFLLKKIEDIYLDQIIDAIKKSKENDYDYSKFAYEFQESFAEIKQYTDKVFASDNNEELKELIYLGTGRLANKRYFDRFELAHLKDYNRREILVLFLNLIAYSGKYLVFGIDEVEKIPERSKIRFNHFLTSYRELIDLFNKINGHYLIIAITQEEKSQKLEEVNYAVYTRVKPDIITIQPISSNKDKKELIKYLNEVFGTNNDVEEVLKLINKLSNLKISENRLLIQEISKILLSTSNEFTDLNQILDEKNLKEEYEYTHDNLIKDDAFKNIHRKFFDPLQYYLESHNRTELVRKQDRYFLDAVANEIQYFIFNEDKDNIENEVINIKELLIKEKENINKVIIYSPKQLELGYSNFSNIEKQLLIIDYDPKELFTLLEIYRENIDLQENLDIIISSYTKNQL